MTPPATRNTVGPLLCLAAIAGAALLAFWPVVNNGWVNWDDQAEIYQAKALNTAQPDFWYAWQQPVQEIYKPVTGSAWWALSQVAYHADANKWGTHLYAKPFHIASLAAHALAGCMLFLLLRQLSGNALASLVGAVLYVVHPLQTEAVAWASGLKDVLAGMFTLAALWQYTVFAQATNRRRYFSYAAATLLLVLAMLSKPSAVAAPAAAMVIDVIFLKRPWWKSLLWLLPWLLLAVPIIVIASLNQDMSKVDSPLWFRPVVALDALAWHLGKVVWPWPMGIDYGRSPDWLLQSPSRYFTWIVPIVVAALAALLWKRARWIAGGLAIMAVLLSPVLGLVPFSFAYYSTVTDHYMYAAMSGMAIVLTFALACLPARRLMPVAAMVPLALAGLAPLSRAQAKLWRNDQTLFVDATLQANPHSFAANATLGFLYAKARDLTLAEQLYRAALAVKPDDFRVNFDYGNLLLDANRPSEAIDHYALAALKNPARPEPHRFLSVALLKVGREQLALHETGIYYQLLGEQFLAGGDYQHAAECFANAVKCDSSNTAARNALEQLRGVAPAVGGQ